MVNENLKKLKQAVKDEKIDLYYLNTSDYHQSEYVPEYFKTIAYFSGFTGSLATFLVEGGKAYLFVDGRYHVQAERQCEGTGIEIVKLGTKDALKPLEFIQKYYAGKVIGLDGKRTSIRFARDLEKIGVSLESRDIYSSLIESRSPLGKDRIYELSQTYTGLSRKKKLEIAKKVTGSRVHIINNLESIAYLLNLRSNDVLYTPVFLSYMVIADEKVYLFVDDQRLSIDLLQKLKQEGIIVLPYESYYGFLKNISGKRILLDENKVNYETYLCLQGRENVFTFERSFIEEMKAIKNPVEQKNMRMAHIYDGIAVLRFLMWLDNADKSKITEYDCANKIDSLRREYKAKDLSFSSIVAANENAAMMHYSPTKDNPVYLGNEGILLFDTGGQYDLGTTDITRTVSLGETDDETKKYFTLVLKSMFNLSEVKFLKGMNGSQLDILARKDLWKLGIDYRCGTGHGVGYHLSVHESPPNIRYGKTENGSELCEFVPGMIVSDEPGVYFEGKFGIRCENLLLCVEDEKNEYGQFLRFDTLTMVPFDLKLIDKKYLDETTIESINRYHEKVFETLLPYLDVEETLFLRKLTKKL